MVYLFLASGAVIDVLVSVARAILFPGSSSFPRGHHKLFKWTGPLQVGLILAGLSVFWRSRRRGLLRMLWVALIVGAGFELSALYILLSNSLSA